MDPTYDALNASMVLFLLNELDYCDAYYHTETRLLDLMQSKHSELQLTRIKQASKEVNSYITLHISHSHQDPSWMTSFQPTYGGEPRLWCLMRADGTDGIEEVVASIEGIICKKDMPPFWEHVR